MAFTHHRADAILTEILDTGTPFVWLHTGNPGPAGTNNIAQNNESDIVRKSVSFGSIENHPDNEERRCLNDAEITWSSAEIDPEQEITHASVWNDETVGEAEFITELIEPKTTATFGAAIAVDSLEVAIAVFAKPV